ncbi:MAG: chemotaxis protein CheR, partial [Selenomonadaceae bacterium]|nr:chemotaxis protein CheR [Selenomonadaceae bacterium]
MMDDKDWEIFKQQLNRKTGIDLQLYKEQQMRRRINNLIQKT